MAETVEKKVETPDGTVMTVSVPVGATEDQIMGFAKKEYEKKQIPAAATSPTGPDYSQMNALELGLTSLSNLPKSAVQFGKDITAPIHSPVQTAKGLYQIGSGIIQMAIPGEQANEKVATAVGKFFVDRYGSVDGIKKAIAEDPVGILSDVAGLGTGGATILGKIGGRVGSIANTAKNISRAVDPATLAARGVGKVLSPRSNPALKTLMDEGVTPTIGQILGGPLGKIEEKMTSVPIVGDVIATGRQRAAKDLTRAAFNRVLKPLGKTADDIPVTRQGLAKVSDELSASYDKLLDNVNFKVDDIFIENVTNVIENSSQILTKEEVTRLNDIVSSKVFGRLAGDADVVTGANLKAVQSELRSLSSKFRRSGPGDAEIGEALSAIHDAVTQSLIRSNPSQANALKAIDTGYANYVRLRKAFGTAGDKSDGLTPASLDAAVRASDTSVGKGDVARGRALMQDISSAGVEVLGSSVPDSGTAGRAMAVGFPAALAAGGAIEPTTAILSLLAASPYIPGAQGLIANMLTRRTAPMQRFGAQMQQYGPTVSRSMYQGGRAGNIASEQDPYLLRTGR